MASRAPFPSDPATFDEDPRISFSKQSQTYLLEDEQGGEWEWLERAGKWSQLMDEELVKKQAEIYRVDGVDEQEPVNRPEKKRKAAQVEDHTTDFRNTKAKVDANANGGASAANAKTPRQNTAVFVSGLPHDVESDEIRAAFSKYGVIAESTDSDKQRIVLYNDKDGNFKGEALVIYHRAESVPNAIYLADGLLFPRLEYDAPSTIIQVVAADSNYKAHKDDTVAEDRPKARGKSAQEKAKIKKKALEMDRRLADWSDDEPSAMQQTSSRWDKVVVLKNVFTLESFVQDPDFFQDAKEDMEEGAAMHGTVKNVTFFDLEEDGVVTIRFSDATAARACANAFEGRMYDGRKLEATIATGEEKFKKTRKVRSAEEDEAKRLEDFSNFIEGKEAAPEDGGKPSASG